MQQDYTIARERDAMFGSGILKVYFDAFSSKNRHGTTPANIYEQFTKEQRYTISVCLRKKMSATAIAKLINVSKSTVSREIKRNLNMYRHYVWIDAQQFSDMRKHIPRRTRRMTKDLWEEIVPLLKRHWSPETVVGVMRRRSLWLEVQPSQGRVAGNLPGEEF